MEGQQHLVNLAHTTPSFPTAHLVWGTGGARDAPGTGGPRLEQAAWPLGNGGQWRSSGRQASPRDERRSRCLGVRRQDSCGIKATPKESRRYWAKAVYFFSLKPIRKGDRQSVSRSVSQPLPQATASQPASPSLRVTGFLQGLARPRRGWCPLSGTGRSPTARASLRGPVRPAAASPRPLPGPPAPARGTDRPRSLPRRRPRLAGGGGGATAGGRGRRIGQRGLGGGGGRAERARCGAVSGGGRGERWRRREGVGPAPPPARAAAGCRGTGSYTGPAGPALPPSAPERVLPVPSFEESRRRGLAGAGACPPPWFPAEGRPLSPVRRPGCEGAGPGGPPQGCSNGVCRKPRGGSAGLGQGWEVRAAAWAVVF